jgi:hypothetical protein
VRAQPAHEKYHFDSGFSRHLALVYAMWEIKEFPPFVGGQVEGI